MCTANNTPLKDIYQMKLDKIWISKNLTQLVYVLYFGLFQFKCQLILHMENFNFVMPANY